jgi:hypothetical protein
MFTSMLLPQAAKITRDDDVITLEGFDATLILPASQSPIAYRHCSSDWANQNAGILRNRR